MEAPSLRHEYTSVSCPIIEQTESGPAPAATGEGAAKRTPEVCAPSEPCDIKLVINGCSYGERDGAGVPLLADA